MTPCTPTIANIKLFRNVSVTYALHTYADGKQSVWVQLGTDKFIEHTGGIPSHAIPYDPQIPTVSMSNE